MCIHASTQSHGHAASGLFPSQLALLEAGYEESDSHWLICAPTGSGKTRMGEWAIERAWRLGLSAAYVAPLRAIVEERIGDWEQRYPERTLGGRRLEVWLGELHCDRPPKFLSSA